MARRYRHDTEAAQGSFFPLPEGTRKNDGVVPPLIDTVLGISSAVLLVSISGGKDSQAMTNYLVDLYKARNWQATVVAVHADLGRIEWPQTGAMVERIAAERGIPLSIVRRPKGDMIDRWDENRARLVKAGKENTPPWSSSAARFCTSDLKRAPINSFICQELKNSSLIVNAMGLRAEESTPREKKPPLTLRSALCASYLTHHPKKPGQKKAEKRIITPEQAYDEWYQPQRGRLCLDWLPIHDWKVEQVWKACGTSIAELERRRKLPDAEAIKDWPAHPAYVLGHGNDRLSCSLCVMASLNDLQNGILYNPETAAALIAREEEWDSSFQNGRWLKDVRAELIATGRMNEALTYA